MKEVSEIIFYDISSFDSKRQFEIISDLQNTANQKDKKYLSHFPDTIEELNTILNDLNSLKTYKQRERYYFKLMESSFPKEKCVELKESYQKFDYREFLMPRFILINDPEAAQKLQNSKLPFECSLREWVDYEYAKITVTTFKDLNFVLNNLNEDVGILFSCRDKFCYQELNQFEKDKSYKEQCFRNKICNKFLEIQIKVNPQDEYWDDYHVQHHTEDFFLNKKISLGLASIDELPEHDSISFLQPELKERNELFRKQVGELTEMREMHRKERSVLLSRQKIKLSRLSAQEYKTRCSNDTQEVSRILSTSDWTKFNFYYPDDDVDEYYEQVMQYSIETGQCPGSYKKERP